jgi:NAD(P)-dependent dehydrogenase (short-subunit alcohol dehydrogenase family)
MKGFFEDGTLDGTAALVTGGGTGLGLETSRTLAALGAKVGILSRNPDHHRAFLDEGEARGWDVASFVCDVREPDVIDSTFDAFVERFGGLDMLVNNAAGNFIRPSINLPPKGWRAVIDIALSGVFYCSQSAARVMEKSDSGGSITNIIATYAWTGCPGVVHSASAKAGVLAMTKTLAGEWAARNIRVNAVAPGPFDSKGAGDRLWPTPEIKEAIRRQVPMGRFASFEEVARSVVYMAAPTSTYITGACLTIDGGMSLGKGLAGENEIMAIMRKRGA